MPSGPLGGEGGGKAGSAAGLSHRTSEGLEWVSAVGSSEAAAADAGPFSRPWCCAALKKRHREVRPPTDTSSSAWLPPGSAR